MKALKRDVQMLIRNMEQMKARAEKLAQRLEALEQQPQQSAPKKSKQSKQVAKPAKPGRKETAIARVLSVVRRSRKGIDTAGIHKKTDIPIPTIRNIVFNLRKQGKIRAERKGLYVKA